MRTRFHSLSFVRRRILRGAFLELSKSPGATRWIFESGLIRLSNRSGTSPTHRAGTGCERTETSEIMNSKDTFIDWLRDAYAMEKALVDTLRKHAADAKDHPEIRKPIEDHLQVTENHAQEVEALLDDLGADKSGLKTAMARFSGLVTGLPSSLADDTLIKNALAEYTSENFEIACYTSLIAAAQELGLEDAVVALESILADEQEMADLLIAAIPEITATHLLETKES